MLLSRINRAVRKHWLSGVLFVAGVLLGIGLSWIIASCVNTLSTADELHRMSDLRNVWWRLVAHAKENGRYPPDLGKVIHDLGFEKLVDERELKYPAAGKEYNEDERYVVIFFERGSRRYGFYEARYMYLQDYEFCCGGRGSLLGL
jgi:hypothetical protein